MNYAELKSHDIANGPGVRVSLFVSGCTHHCKDCFNKEAWDFDYGKPFDQGVIDHILELLKPAYIKGITYLGGEPLDPRNQPALLELSRQIQAAYPEKSIWCFTGYVLEDLLEREAVIPELLTYFDVLVDGPFIAEQKNLRLKFRGSENQRLLDMKKTLSCGSAVLWEDSP
ncbi:MAG: anaerobic ribonucleoside-triphosphate reductase activating protein [Oscillospiraceae bacterium]|nr:anaerobic ribonucleoside-triphosphate reductase activating protein [Oscillospiraceae bacterium]